MFISLSPCHNIVADTKYLVSQKVRSGLETPRRTCWPTQKMFINVIEEARPNEQNNTLDICTLAKCGRGWNFGGRRAKPRASGRCSGSQPWAWMQGLQNWGTPEPSSLFHQVSPPSPSAERCNLRVQLRQVGSPPALSAETLVRLR